MRNEPTDAELDILIDDVAGLDSSNEAFRKFASAIEAEMRKQDDALIQQMLDALETCDSADGYNGPYQFHDDKAVEAAINAARARWGEKT